MPGGTLGSAHAAGVGAALRNGQTHPEIVFRTDYWLSLIASRLNHLALCMGKLAGLSMEERDTYQRALSSSQLPPLDDAWIADLIALEEAKSEAETEREEAAPGNNWEDQAASLFGDGDRFEDE